MGRARRGLDVNVTDARGRPARAPGLASWLRRASPARARGAVTIALVSDARIRQLNRTYRRKDCTTDVLSFPEVAQPFRAAIALRPAQCVVSLSNHAGLEPCATRDAFLGDIVIARGVAQRQARDRGHSAAVELRVLALHGLLHLLGYDHERDGGRMRKLEHRLLRENGIDSGLIDRASGARGSTGSPRALNRHARPELVEGRAARR